MKGPKPPRAAVRPSSLTAAQEKLLLNEIREASQSARGLTFTKVPAAVARARKVVKEWQEAQFTRDAARRDRILKLRANAERAVIFAKSQDEALKAVADYRKAIKEGGR